MDKRCLIIDEMHPGIIPMLENIGYVVHYKPGISRAEILQTISEYTGMVVRSKTAIDKEIIEAAINLKFVARAGAGVDQLDTETLANKGIVIINAPEGNRDAVAEHAVGMLLNILNKMRVADRQIRNYRWDREGNRGFELKGKTVAIIGYGFMGKTFAQKLSSFGCKLIAFDKYKKGFSNDFVLEVDQDQLFEQADILSFHVPLTKETKGYFDYHFFCKFKKPVYIINTARGEIIPMSGLLQHLEEGKIIAAGLDVLENEKINQLNPHEKELFHTLIQSDKVLLTPHVAGWTYESYVKINEIITKKIALLNIT